MKLNIKITDKDLEKVGAWVDWELGDGIRVKLIRSTTEESQKHLQTLLKKNRKAVRNTSAMKDVLIKFLSNHIVVDWEGITDDKEELPFTVENAMAVFKDAPDFREWVYQESQSLVNFLADDEDEDDTTVEERGEELKK